MIFKRLMSAVSVLVLTASPVLANSGHPIQVHRGADCIEFATLEDAIAVCGGINNVYLANGTVNPSCLSETPWYAVSTSAVAADPTQLPTFLAWSGAIETAFHETQAVAGILDVQQGEGFGVPTWEYNLLWGPGSALGFNTGAALTCKNMAVQGTHSAIAISNLNTPPAAYQ